MSFSRSSLEDKSEDQNVFQSDKRTSNNSSSSTKHGDLLSAMLLARVDRRDSDGGDSDDVPPPLPTTSPPKLSPDSTLTWDHKERMQLKLGNFQRSYYKLYSMFSFYKILYFRKYFVFSVFNPYRTAKPWTSFEGQT